MNTDNRTPLRRAVDKLISDGKIKQDKDLQGIFNLSKSTISAYLNNPRPGKQFLIQFEKKFGISLSEFDKSNGSTDDKAKITALEAENIRLRLNQIESNLKTLTQLLSQLQENSKKSLSNQEMIMRVVKAHVMASAKRHAGKDAEAVLREIEGLNKLIFAPQ